MALPRERIGGTDGYGPAPFQDPTQPGGLVDQLENWLDAYQAGSITLPGSCRPTEKEVKRLPVKARRAAAELEAHWAEIDQHWEQYQITQALAMRGVLERAAGPANPQITAGLVMGLGRNAMVLGRVGVFDPAQGGRMTTVLEPSLVLRSPEGYGEAGDLLKGSEEENRVFNIVDADIGRVF